MLNPQFPYKGNQIIIDSGRVTLHAKADAVFIFAAKGIGLSTPATLNIDAPEQVVINSEKIELGLRASVYGQGEPLLKGETVLKQLDRFFAAIDSLATTTAAIAAASSSPEWSTFSTTVTSLNNTAKDVNLQLKKAISKTTYTR